MTGVERVKHMPKYLIAQVEIASSGRNRTELVDQSFSPLCCGSSQGNCGLGFPFCNISLFPLVQYIQAQLPQGFRENDHRLKLTAAQAYGAMLCP